MDGRIEVCVRARVRAFIRVCVRLRAHAPVSFNTNNHVPCVCMICVTVCTVLK